MVHFPTPSADVIYDSTAYPGIPIDGGSTALHGPLVECVGSGTLDPCHADLDGSGMVDGGDLVVILSAWGSTGCHAADLSDDGLVSAEDLTSVLSGWGACPGG